MIGAIASSNYAVQQGSGKSTAGLEAQLAQYETKLADWVSCPSCKTPEGKAKIAELTEKVSELKQRQAAADAARSNRQPTIPSPDASSARALQRSNDGPVGSRLDVFA